MVSWVGYRHIPVHYDRGRGASLMMELSGLTRPGFRYCPHPYLRVVERQFNHSGNEAEVVKHVAPHLETLIQRTYQIID